MADPLQNLPPPVAAALQRGNVIEAIKLLRQQKPQMGLAEARALIEALQKQANVKVNVKTSVTTNVHHANKPHAPQPHAAPHPSMNPYASPGEVPRTSNVAAFVGVVVAIIVVVAAALYFGS